MPELEVGLRQREHFQADYKARNPSCMVPTLELDDSTCIGESDAICLYFEALQPEPPLMGSDARTRALRRAWDRWVSFDGLISAMDGFRNAAPGLERRAVLGPHPIEQIPALAERGARRYRYFLDDLDARLASSTPIAHEASSIADLTALVTIDFARDQALELRPEPRHEHLNRWHERVTVRPGVTA